MSAILFPTAEAALAYFQSPATATTSTSSAADPTPPAAEGAGAQAPAPAATVTAPDAPKPGALARLFAGGQLAEVQTQLANALTEANALRAELSAAQATNATLLEAVNLAAGRLASQPQQIAAQVADISASLGLPASALPSAEPLAAEQKPVKESLLAQYEAISDPAARRAFFKANKAGILAAQAMATAPAAE